MNNVLYSLGASIASKVVMLIVNVVSFRVLNSENYGIISLLLVMAATVGAVSGMGASVAVNSMVAKEGKSNISILFVKYNYLLSLFTSFIMAVGVYFIYSNGVSNLEPWQTFIFIFAFSYLSSLNSISEAILTGFHKFKRKFINNVITFLLSMPIFAYLIFNFDYIGVLAALIIYRALLSLMNLLSVKYTSILGPSENNKVDHAKVINMFKKLSVPVIASGLMVAPIIGFAFKIVSIQDNGLTYLAYFNIIYQIYLVAIFIPNALNGYFISLFSKQNQSSSLSFASIGLYNFIFSLVVIVALLLCKDIVFWVIGDNNQIIIRNYYIMLGTIVFFSINAVFASFWPSIDKAWYGFIVNIIWALVLILTTYILSVNKVAEAIAWAFLLSYLVLTIIQTIGYIRFSYGKK